MEGCSPHRAKQAWKIHVAVVFCVVVVALVVAITTMFCQPAAVPVMAGNCSVRLEWLEEALAVTNRSLTEALQQREVCRNKLVGAGVLPAGGGLGPYGETCSPSP